MKSYVTVHSSVSLILNSLKNALLQNRCIIVYIA